MTAFVPRIEPEGVFVPRCARRRAARFQVLVRLRWGLFDATEADRDYFKL